jgi:DNA-binding Lrp family transcriptional regulator
MKRTELSGPLKLDDVDRRLIDELRRDSRTPATVLARRLKIPRVTIQYRLRRLRKSGVIRRFTVMVDRAADGKDLTAFTLISTAPGFKDIKRIGYTLGRIPGVAEVHDVTGRIDFVIKIHGSSLREIGKLVNRIREVPGIASTETLTCVLTYKEEF